MAVNYHLRVKRRGLGDTVGAGALIRDLHRAYPGVRTSVDGAWSDQVFLHDPRVTPRAEGAVELALDYKPVVDRSRTDKSARFVYGLTEEFERLTGLSVPRGPARPELVLSPDEQVSPQPEPYSVLLVGVKVDIPIKAAPPALVDQVVALTSASGRRWVQLGLLRDDRFPHHQRAVPGARNLLGVTSVRGLFRWIRHAEVVLCLVSAPMLIASALGTPCVALAGGREDPWLHADNGCTYLHTVGELPCCLTAGCRCSVAVPGHRESSFPPGFVCADPVHLGGGEWVGRCMTRLTPERVVSELERAAAGKIPLPTGHN